jgi:putative transposase
MKALEAALLGGGPTGRLLHHPDRGSPRAREDSPDTLDRRGITCGMSRCGHCHDSGATERWFSTPRSVRGERIESNAQAKERLFHDIMVFYKQQRLPSAIGQVSPVEFERAAREIQAASSPVCGTGSTRTLMEIT